MEDGNNSQPDQNSPQSFTAVSFDYDQKSKMLSAVLSKVEHDPQVNWESLNRMIADNGYVSFKIEPRVLEELLRKVQRGETGTMKLAEKPEYTAIKLVYDEATRRLDAVLSATDNDPCVSWASLQEMITANGFDSCQVTGATLQDLLKRVENKEQGSFKIGEKPIFIQVELVYHEETRTLYAALTSCEDNPQITLNTLQEMIRENHYEDYLSKPTILPDLLNRITRKEKGSFPIGEKPEFTEVKLAFDEHSNRLNAVLSATDEKQDITLESLQTLITDNHYDKFWFEKDTLTKLLDQINKKQRGSFAIAERRDAAITIEISDDEMSATISTIRAYGGKSLDKMALKQAVIDNGIKIKLCEKETLKKTLKQPSVENLLLAKGKPPHDGEDSKFTPLVEEVIYHAPKADKKGIVDLHDIQDFTLVEIGAPLMRRTPATAGTAGCNVRGEVVPASAGNEIDFMDDMDGATLDPKDSNLLIAKSKGHPLIKPNGVRIDKTLKVTNVNVVTGNIEFDGSLLVTGDIASGIEVDVTGSVIVKGIITRAKVKTGNDITVGGGIIGGGGGGGGESSSHEDHSMIETHIESGGTITAQYVSYSTIKAIGVIAIKEYISHCEAESDSQILLGQNGGKGRIIGGYCHAKETVIAKALGSEAAIKTFVSVGYSAKLKQEYDFLSEERNKNQKQIEQISNVLTQLAEAHEHSALPPGKVEKAKLMKNNIILLTEENKKITERQESMKSAFKETVDAKIIIKENLYPNILLAVNGAEFENRKENKGGTFTLQGKDIKWETSAASH